MTYLRPHSTEGVGAGVCNPQLTIKPWKSFVSEFDVIPVQSKDDKSIDMGK